MKILHLNTFDIEGGAARAAYRLHRGLRETGTDSNMLVQTKTGTDAQVFERDTPWARWLGRYRPLMELLPMIPYPSRPATHWATEWAPTRILPQINALAPDVIHLHWICRGFMSIPDIGRLPRPVVWTLHDAWAFTGGCHVPGSCTLYRKQCGMCPQLASTEADDLSRWIWERKAKCWQARPVTIVTPSQWLADCARSSALFCKARIEVIPNAIDTSLFRPMDQQEARAELGLPQKRKLVLVSAMNATLDINKGFRHLQKALHLMAGSGWKENMELLVVGQSAPSTPVDAGVPVRFLGVMKDEHSMRRIYSAADVTVLSSIQENLPNAVMESMACGTPAVAFKIGGLPQLIDHGLNGYLATPYDPADLAEGIRRVLSGPADHTDHPDFSANARRKIESCFDTRIVVRQYQALYQSL